MIFCVRSEDSAQGRNVSHFLFRSCLLFYVKNRVHVHFCFPLLYQVLRLIKEKVRPKSKLYENPSCTYVKNFIMPKLYVQCQLRNLSSKSASKNMFFVFTYPYFSEFSKDLYLLYITR